MNRERKNELGAVFGLLILTAVSAYLDMYLPERPDRLSVFGFMFVSNLIGMAFLSIFRFRKWKMLNRRLLKKGLVIGAELNGFTAFMLIGTKGVMPIAYASVASMHFIFVLILLVLLRKRVSFRSAVASVVAISALILMFGSEASAAFAMSNGVYLLLADLCLAAYIVSAGLLGKDEDSTALSFAVLLFFQVFSGISWCLEVASGNGSFNLSASGRFWGVVILIGIFLRGIYTSIQIKCQKYVKPLNTSLIFASGIIFTLMFVPIMQYIRHQQVSRITFYQVVGAVFFVIAIFVADDHAMKRFGYTDMEYRTYNDPRGKRREQVPLAKKLINVNLVLSIGSLLILAIAAGISFAGIRNNFIEQSQKVGNGAVISSFYMLEKDLERQLLQQTRDKAEQTSIRFRSYSDAVGVAADVAQDLYKNPNKTQNRELSFPVERYRDKWAMYRVLDEGVSYASVRDECALLGNLKPVFSGIASRMPYVTAIYLATESGLMVCYDKNAALGILGEENYYSFKESPWYQLGKEERRITFTKPYQDYYGKELTITCVSPVLDAAGNFKGCIGLDISMSDMNKSIVNSDFSETSYAVIMDEDGDIIAGAGTETMQAPVNYKDNPKTPIRTVAYKILSEKQGVLSILDTSTDMFYVAFCQIPKTNWKYCLFSHADSTAEDVGNKINEFMQTIVNTTDSINNSVVRIVYNCMIVLCVIVLVITYFVGKISRKITTPLMNLEKDVHEISKGNFNSRTTVETNDEIGSLAHSFNSMAESLQRYIDDLKSATVREERNRAELSVATQIQEGLLPSSFPAFPDRKEFDIYASMNPAKEVGGDFYDFYLVDEDHLVMTIADVSGKGVPAALFMMMSKTLLKNQMLFTKSPATVLEIVNRLLCENNQVEMFVTAWFAVLEISTGKVTAANAGHEYPAIRRGDGSFELYYDKHGFVLAGMEGMKYKEYEFQLDPGDALFVYTDGVTEATNAKNELFGTDRMLDALNLEPGASPQDLLLNVERAIDHFVDDAPQFDDITMLCIKILEKTDGDRNTMQAKIENINPMIESVEALMEEKGLPIKTIMQINIALDEVLTNIARYAYDGEDGTFAVDVDFNCMPGNVVIDISDSGKPFNPLTTEEPDITLSAEERQIGGLGIFMVKKTMDDVKYAYRDGRNVLTLIKSIN